MAKKTALILTISGLILAVSSVLILQLLPRNYGTFLYKYENFIGFIFFLGLVLLIIGFIMVARIEGLGKYIGWISVGSLLLIVGTVMTIMQIKGEIRAVYIVGFIPIPMIVLTPLGAIVGAVYLIRGFVVVVKAFFEK